MTISTTSTNHVLHVLLEDSYKIIAALIANHKRAKLHYSNNQSESTSNAILQYKGTSFSIIPPGGSGHWPQKANEGDHLRSRLENNHAYGDKRYIHNPHHIPLTTYHLPLTTYHFRLDNFDDHQRHHSFSGYSLYRPSPTPPSSLPVTLASKTHKGMR